MLIPLIAAGVVLAGLLATRMVSQRRVRSAERAAVDRPRGADGVIVGAESMWLDAHSDRVALVLHGFNDTPQSVAEMARALHARGWSVSAPLLPFHGRSSKTLADHGNADIWIAFAHQQWTSTRALAPRAVLIGQSMGGALAVIVAAEEPPAALVLLAPYLSMGRFTKLLARVWPVWQLVVPTLVSDPQKGIRDPEARSQTLGGGEFTPRLVGQLLRIVQAARDALGRLGGPVLVVHANRDYRIPSRNAQDSFKRIATGDKTLVWREKAGHVLTADVGRAELFALVGDWIDSKVAPSVPG